MLFKEKDDQTAELVARENALRIPMDRTRKQQLEKELAIFRAGLRGEREAAYYIDFDLKASDNWAVIHDLRIESKGRTAQIDHLLISRWFEIYVIESKSFSSKLRYANGGWERMSHLHGWEGISCPVEQNRRHIAVLTDLIKEHNLAPTRLGFTMPPGFVNIVAVMPTCSILSQHTETTHLHRMDKLIPRIRAKQPTAQDVLKIISCETLHEFARKLLAHHQPVRSQYPPLTPFAYSAALQETSTTDFSATPVNCAECNAEVDSKVVFYCRVRLKLPNGRVLCRKCQKLVAA